ncbi:MAG: hypothetical protein KKB34_00375 [Bacteroidetes bacterium]|nr:hypothetical protein [Bacteroidota bacterium]
MKMKSLVMSLFFMIAGFAFAQEKISILEIDKAKEYLHLNEEQYKVIKLKTVRINTILNEDQKIIEGLKERFKNGDEPGFFEKISVKRGRDKRKGDIEDLLEDIKEQLNDKQLMKFKNIEKPGLKSLSKKELTDN